MKTDCTPRVKLLLLVVCLTVYLGETAAQAAVNMAVVAKPSTSYVSGDTSVSALNDGREPTRSRDRRRGSYGNWPRTGTQWVQYDWALPISTNKIQVFWWDDRQGVRLPAAARLLYWDGSALRDRMFNQLSDEWQTIYNCGLITETMEQRAPGSMALDERMFGLGFKKAKQKIEAAIEQLDFINDFDATDKREQLSAMAITCDGMMIYAKRYADLLEKKASGES